MRSGYIGLEYLGETSRDGFDVQVDNRNGNFEILEIVSGNGTTLKSSSQDWSNYGQQWLRYEIDWGVTTDNEITAEIYEDSTDTLINPLTATSSENQSNQGFGTLVSNGSLSSGYSAYFDYFRATNTQ